MVLRAGEDLGHLVLALDVRGVVRQQGPAHLQHVRAGTGAAGQDGPHHRPVEGPRDVQLPGQAEAPGVLLVVSRRPVVRSHAGEDSLPLRVDEDEAEDAPVYQNVGGQTARQGGV